MCNITYLSISQRNLAAISLVDLVCNDHRGHLVANSTALELDITDPVYEVVERLLVGDVVHEQDAVSAAIGTTRQVSEAFFASRVPLPSNNNKCFVDTHTHTRQTYQSGITVRLDDSQRKQGKR